MASSQPEQEELGVLGRVMDYSGILLLRGKRPTPAQYMGLLGYSVEQTPRYAAALQRLMDRHIVSIMQMGNKWVLAEVAGRATAERDRLRALQADPKELLEGQFTEMAGLLTRARGALDDPAAILDRAQALLAEMRETVSRLTN